LLKKYPGLFGAGKWNAPGGKLQPKETAEQCASREVHEETGLTVQQLREIGTLVFFKYDKREDPDWIAGVFLTNKFHGTIKEGKEGILQWFPVNKPPFDEMWEDDRYWYGYAVEGRSFRGNFYFRGDFEKLVDHRIELL
jgi:8-oxo-dGTP pyrophosphatase MutT (NUDIX family)